MNQTEVMIMAMRLEREIDLRRHLAEGHTLQALGAQPSTSTAAERNGARRLARDAALAWRGLQSRWLALGQVERAGACVCAD